MASLLSLMVVLRWAGWRTAYKLSVQRGAVSRKSQAKLA